MRQTLCHSGDYARPNTRGVRRYTLCHTCQVLRANLRKPRVTVYCTEEDVAHRKASLVKLENYRRPRIKVIALL